MDKPKPSQPNEQSNLTPRVGIGIKAIRGSMVWALGAPFALLLDFVGLSRKRPTWARVAVILLALALLIYIGWGIYQIFYLRN